MFRFPPWLLTAALSVAAGELRAASAPAGFLPAISIQVAEPANPDAYVSSVGQINSAMKARHEVPMFLRVYAAVAAGEDGPPFFALCPAASFAALQKNLQVFADDVELAEARTYIESAHAPGTSALLKAVRFDGTHAPGWLLNTHVLASEEAGYLAGIETLRALFDEHGFTDVRLNVFRVMAGRSSYSHLFSINTPSAERLAAVLDVLATATWAVNWSAGSSRRHTPVRSGTYREITP